MGLSEVYGGQNYVIVYNIFNIIYNIKYYYNTRLAKLNLTFRYGGIPIHIIQVNEWRIRIPVYLYTLPSHKGPRSGVARVCGTQYALFGIRDFRHSLQRQRVVTL